MSEKKVGVTEGIVLASIPVIGYWLAYLYYRGYATYFDFPGTYIEIDTSSVLAAVMGMGTALLILHSYMDALYLPFRMLPRVLKIKLLHLAFLVVFYASCAVAFRWPWANMLKYGGPILALYLLVQFLLPVVMHREVKGYIAKLEADHKISQSVPKLMDFYSEHIDNRVVISLIVLYFISLIAFFSGSYDAKISRQFIILNQDKELVVLKQFGSSYLTAEFNRKTKQIVQRFRLIPIDRPDLQLTYEVVGPLEPVDRPQEGK